MLKSVNRIRYDKNCEELVKRYEAAGLTPTDCLIELSDLKGRYASGDGYADGVIVSGITLFFAGLFCKWMARRQLDQMCNQVQARLNYAASIKPLTDFKVPTGDDETRVENND